MPELPEVETVVRTLKQAVKDCKIVQVDIYWNNIIVGDLQVFKSSLIGQSFRRFKRRGKYIIFELDDCSLLSHLRMEGKYFIKDCTDKKEKHEHVIFTLDNGKTLRYHDTRKFGKMEVIPKSKDYVQLKNLGVEPLSHKLNETYVSNYIKNTKQCMKQLLLDQSFIAGIGNIYADEILFRMKVHPKKIAKELTPQEIIDLVYYTKHVLKGAIRAGGTTIRSYTSSLGITGRFQLKLKVHMRKNEPCYLCKEKIVKEVVAQRGTYYCPRCQSL